MFFKSESKLCMRREMMTDSINERKFRCSCHARGKKDGAASGGSSGGKGRENEKGRKKEKEQETCVSNGQRYGLKWEKVDDVTSSGGRAMSCRLSLCWALVLFCSDVELA